MNKKEMQQKIKELTIEVEKYKRIALEISEEFCAYVDAQEPDTCSDDDDTCTCSDVDLASFCD